MTENEELLRYAQLPAEGDPGTCPKSRVGGFLLGVLRAAGNTVLAIWLFGGAAFFLVRFTVVVYEAHKMAITPLLGTLHDIWGRIAGLCGLAG